ncbi:phosphate signaling complex protein PhoU [Heyndrickxia ginsengihumi]|uniref:Phosphate-specific transport system accessory protein PhoU n=1 Tax=Heyndrickxia ginsengihumi TaxID=363870 RepID=A0A0A6VFU3_9BACI|nr:phosphate signaling complex protein PhoU [Heyndrickxia ginsengihumi]KHD86451.1 PhoU family transcriptional regulator [Heyndrickxia ginsengihumi]MBE6185025.1 phosphate signaling complex protein PhoU [Bacillus sp. (in: firmicutes)]MCM3023356.1 phosphate signaling complex protein PhoU [Heyndrickxia ginsengihumi]NEY19198.1 phosphate signaling complex protein PhoU [Heyndrickxia ginsengihumi]
MVRRMFEDRLLELHETLFKMGLLVEEAIYKSVQSFIEKDSTIANEVILEDQKINDFEIEIEKKCFELIATQQPVGKDLRLIATMLKVSTDLERIGDHAVSIAKTTGTLRYEPAIHMYTQIQEMANTVKSMVHEGLDAFIALDETKAIEVSKRDDDIDRDFKLTFSELVELMKHDQSNIQQASYLLLVVQHLERIGDYVTNVCEWIVYLKTGSLVDLN